ncbi:hypothetical protein WNY61_03400 [Sulfitobacter sp. AS92]|uniref:hypothetical protein n=1 Tax=Sulfitobacter sp. AS92 TaxID=3135783 RepID=UPI00317A071E
MTDGSNKLTKLLGDQATNTYALQVQVTALQQVVASLVGFTAKNSADPESAVTAFLNPIKKISEEMQETSEGEKKVKSQIEKQFHQMDKQARAVAATG